MSRTTINNHDERTTNAAFPSPFLCEMPLDVGPEVLNIVQHVCDRALNVATASAKSSTHGGTGPRRV